MVIKTASPGVVVNEVDLTRGTSDAITTNVGAFVGPFARGPVDEIVLVNTENDLSRIFGDPTPENAEYWYTVANFLEYGGVCYVVRCDDASGGAQTMKNAVTNGAAAFIKNYDDFEENTDDGTSLGAYFVARTPGAYGNALGVAIIDSGADVNVKLQTTGQKTATGAAASDATRPTGGTPGTGYGDYEQLKVAAYATPTAFAAVATAAKANIDITAGNQDINGVTTTDGMRVLLAGQANNTTNGIYIAAGSSDWVRATDADASEDFQFGKPCPVSGGSLAGTFYYTGQDDPTVQSGTGSALPFVQTDPTPSSLSVGDYVVLGDPLSGGAATGFVSAISATDATAVTVAVASGTFVGAIGTDSHLENAAGNEISGKISIAEAYFSVTQYSAINPADPTVIETLYAPATYTVTQGTGSFGWSAKPYPGQAVTTTAGAAYEYSADRSQWEAVPNLAAGGIVGYAGTFYTIEVVDNWYEQQIAFGGIPWYRLAPRPTTSLNAVNRGASNDEMNIIVYDATGDETRSQYNILEEYIGVSKLKGAVSPEGEPNYYRKVINERSGYIYAGAIIPVIATGTLNDNRAELGTAIGAGVKADYVVGPANMLLQLGVDQFVATVGERQLAYNKFVEENVEDVDYILQGPAGTSDADATAIGNFLINIVEERRDCMCFLSPRRGAVVGLPFDKVTQNIIDWAHSLASSSYACFDSGYKYSYDRFNDQYMYMPLNGDTAGCVVHTALTAEPYYSPAGIARGQIRNVVKLAYNPSKAQRDQLYTSRVNPVCHFPGEGTVLFGDKTGLAYSSAFDRMNVRRLFLVVERELAEIARTNLFEFNDEVTRTLFKNNVNPFLRDIQAKRGMIDFLVVCDETNNPPEIVDRNELVADIYIKPAKSINFITLTFVATKTGASFEESVAQLRGTTGATGT